MYNFIYFYLCTVNINFLFKSIWTYLHVSANFFIVLYYHTGYELNKGRINVRVYFQITSFVNLYYRKYYVKRYISGESDFDDVN